MPSSSGQDDRGTELCIVLAVVLGTAWVFVFLRAYTRFFMVKNVAADDWWMFAAMIAYTGYTSNGIYGVLEGGAGRHVSQLTEYEIYIGLKLWYVSEVLYAPVSALVRTSVALFLLRVSVVPLHRSIIVANLSAIWAISFVFMFVVSFQCDPPSYFYDQVLGMQGRCMDASIVPNVTIAHSVVGAACDLVFASLPVAMLWNVQMNKRTKVVIALLLGMGGVAGVALIVRIPYIKVLAISPDFLYETIDVAIWSVLEPSLGIIAGCAATFRPIFKSMGFGRSTAQRRDDDDDYYYDGSSSRRHGGGGGGAARSSRTWLSSLGGGPGGGKLADGGLASPSPGAAHPAHPGPPAAAFQRRRTWSSIHSGDIEMQQGPEAAAPGEAAVRTRIVGRWVQVGSGAGLPAEESRLRGMINVHTSIHTESKPVT